MIRWLLRLLWRRRIRHLHGGLIERVGLLVIRVVGFLHRSWGNRGRRWLMRYSKGSRYGRKRGQGMRQVRRRRYGRRRMILWRGNFGIGDMGVAVGRWGRLTCEQVVDDSSECEPQSNTVGKAMRVRSMIGCIQFWRGRRCHDIFVIDRVDGRWLFQHRNNDFFESFCA